VAFLKTLSDARTQPPGPTPPPLVGVRNNPFRN
jgi:hypothetical protein